MIEPTAHPKVTANLSKYWRALHNTQRLALHAAIYTWAARKIPPGRVVDLGCEYGFGAVLMAETNPTLQVLGIDLDLSALRYSSNLPFRERIKRVNAQASKLPICSQSLSGVAMINILHMVEEPTSILFEAQRALKVGGVAVISIPRANLDETRHDRADFIQHLKVEIHAVFSQVMYPYEIRGQLPSFPRQTFRLHSQTPIWVAMCVNQ